MPERTQDPTMTRREGTIAASTLVTSLTQFATMGLGGVLALLVGVRFGKNAETDGLFAAYGVYGLLLILAVSVRTTLPARLLEGGRDELALDRFLGAALGLSLVMGIPLLVLGGPLSELLTGGLAHKAHATARTGLAVLWPAAAAQLTAAVAAAALGVRGEFALAGGAYVAGSLVAIAGMLALSGPVGIDAVPIALVIGALVTATLPLARLRASGWRPDLRRLVRQALRPAAFTPIVVGAVAYVVSQLTLVVSLGFAARLGTGAVTTYTYSFFAAALLVGTSAGSVGVVLAAPMARSWDRRPASLFPHLVAVSRAGFTLLLPAIGLVAIVGDELVQVVLGNSFDAADADKLVHTFLWLSGFVLLNVPAIVPAVAAFALGRYRAVAGAALVAGCVHVGGSALAVHFDGLEALAAATSLTNVVFVGLLTAVVFGRDTGAAALLAGRELAPLLAIAATCFGLAAGVASLMGGGGLDAVAAIGALALYALLVRWLLPERWEAVQRLLQPLAARLRQPA